VLRVLAERPGVGASELAAAAGVKKAVLYALLSRLVDEGEIVKEALPSGSTGYALPRGDAEGPTAAEQDPGGDSTEEAAEPGDKAASLSALAA
jgi:hypothetical protein